MNDSTDGKGTVRMQHVSLQEIWKGARITANVGPMTMKYRSSAYEYIEKYGCMIIQ